MNTKIVGISIAAVIGIIVLGSVLMPILDDATAKTDTFKNEGYFYLDKFEDSYSFYWDSTTPNTFTVNGEDMTYLNDSGLAVSVVLGEKFAVRLANNNTSISFYGNGSYVSTNAEKPTFTLTLSDGTLTATNGTDTKTISSVPEIFGIVEEGNYVMKKTASTAYLNSGSQVIADSEIYASGQTYNGANNVWWHLEGTIDDMEYPDTFNSALTITDGAIHGQYNSSHDDLYELDNITFTVTTSTAVVYNVTASYFVVPAEVTAERSVHFTDGQNAILGAIPIMIIAAILLGIVALVIRSRME